MAESSIGALAEQLPGLTLVNIYGSTETSSPAVIMPLGECTGHPDKVGRALPYCDIVVMDEDGRQVPYGERGEIWIGGAITVSRYWKSGDIGVMDEQGYIRLLDRKKDMINAAASKSIRSSLKMC